VGTVLLAGTIACIAANAFEVGAKVMRADFVVQNATEVGVRRDRLSHLAMIEGAGVVGLLAGFVGLPLLGVAAATGLVAFFVIAVAAHIRTRVLHNIGFPLAFLGLAAVALGYFARVVT
jgi:hypothetical protein